MTNFLILLSIALMYLKPEDDMHKLALGSIFGSAAIVYAVLLFFGVVNV